MLSAAVLLVLGSTQPLAVALPDLNGVRLAAGEAQLYTELLSQRLAARRVKVTTSRDISTLLGLERQRQLLADSACAGDCVAELAAALGVDAVVVGDLGRTDSGFALALKILSASDGSVLAFYSDAPADEKALAAALDRAAWELLVQLRGTLSAQVDPGSAPKVTVGALPVSRTWGWAPVAVGVLGVGVGAVGFALSQTHFSELQRTSSQAAALDARNAGKQEQLLGAIGCTVGAAALAVGASMLLLGERRVELVAWGAPNAGGLAVGGTLP